MERPSHFLLAAVFLLFTGKAIGQQTDLRLNEQTKILQFLDSIDPWLTTPDSTKYYSFSFKISVEKSSGKKIRIVSITANDSIAYKIYPQYQQLANFEYAVLLEGRKKADFILPVFLTIIGSKRPFAVPFQNPADLVPQLFWNANPAESGSNLVYLMPHVVTMDKEVVN